MKQIFANVDDLSIVTYSPWKSREYLDGTDGFQFSPELGKDVVIGNFMSNFFRNMYFEYREKDKSSYRHFNLHTYGIQDQMF